MPELVIIVTTLAVTLLVIIAVVMGYHQGARAASKRLHSSFTINDDSREQRVASSVGKLRGVLIEIAEAVQVVEGASDASEIRLTETRARIDGLTHVDGLESSQRQLLSAVDHVLASNAELRRDLTIAREGLARQREQIDELETMVRIDQLTQLGNRASFDEAIEVAWDGWERRQERFCLLMLDIDHFKRINDEYGHATGDRVLQGVAYSLKGALRGADFIARYGGEEFASLLLHTSFESAMEVAERMREAVAEEIYRVDHRQVAATVSIGVAETLASESQAELFRRADEALYAAKQAGRNCIRAASRLDDETAIDPPDSDLES